MNSGKKSKKLLILGERFYPEEFLINDLAPALVEAGFDVSVLTQNPSYPQDKLFPGFKNKLFQKEKWKGITVLRFFTVLGYKSSLIKKILNYLSFVFFSTVILLFTAYKYDRIFIYHTGPLTQGFAPALFSRIYRKKLSIWTQDIWPDSVFAYGFKRNFLLVFALKTFVKFVYRSCDSIMVSSPGFVNKVKQYVSETKIDYVPQWVMPVDEENNETIKLPCGINFTFAGNIGKVQNLENVIRAFAAVSQKNSDVYLNLVGDGSHLNFLKKLVHSENIKNVIFHGRKSPAVALSTLRSSDALILPLANKPIFALTVPLKFQTYLKAGRAIFAVTRGEIASLVREHSLGYVAAPEDISAITEGFEKFIKTDQDTFSKMGLACEALLAVDFDRGKNIKKIIGVIG